ncbi:hypothetical protein [Flindersiella endophytica]
MNSKKRVGLDSPVGYERIFDLVAELLRCTKGSRSRDLPVVLLFGPRASGKTHIAQYLEELYNGVVPFSGIGLGAPSMNEARKVLVEVSYELSRRSKQTFNVRFPLLTLCLIVAGAPIALAAAPAARRQQMRAHVHRRLRWFNRLFTSRPNVAQAARIIQRVAGLPDWFEGAAHVLISGLGWAGERRLLTGWGKWLGTVRRWARAGDWIDVAIHINQQLKLNTMADVRAVDDLLFDAFLEDLHRSFNGVLTSFDRPLKYLAVLDDADSKGGRRFCDAYVRATHSRHRDDKPPAPLVLVASSRTLPSSAVDPARPGGTPRTLAQLGYEDWDSERDVTHRGERSWSYPVRLGDISPDDVRQLAEREDFDDPRQLAEITHWLTTGHSGSAVDVLQTIIAADTRKTVREVLLTRPAPAEGEQRSSAAERLLERWLADAGADLRHALRRAAALDISTPPAADVLDLEEPQVEDLRRAMTGQLWDVDATYALRSALVLPVPALRARAEACLLERFGGSDRRPPLMHPFLRRLLQQAVVREGGYDDEHERLVTYHDRRGEQPQRAHHRLALGEVAAAVEYLDSRFCQTDLVSWLVEVALVTSAPKRPGDQPAQQPADLPPDPERADAIHGLVTALWQLADRFGGPARFGASAEELHVCVGNRYQELVRFADGQDAKDLLHELERIYHENPLPWDLPGSAWSLL